MSDQTWTDEQLQEHLTQWGVLTGEDGNNFKITLSTKPNIYPFMESSHKLSYEDTSIALTFLQALQVNDWMREQYELHNPEPKAEHANEELEVEAMIRRVVAEEIRQAFMRFPIIINVKEPLTADQLDCIAAIISARLNTEVVVFPSELEATHAQEQAE